MIDDLDTLPAAPAAEREGRAAFFAVEPGPHRALVSKVPRILPARVVLVEDAAIVVGVPERSASR